MNMKLSIRFKVEDPSSWFDCDSYGQVNTEPMTPMLALLIAQACQNTASELGLKISNFQLMVPCFIDGIEVPQEILEFNDMKLKPNLTNIIWITQSFECGRLMPPPTTIINDPFVQDENILYLRVPSNQLLWTQIFDDIVINYIVWYDVCPMWLCQMDRTMSQIDDLRRRGIRNVIFTISRPFSPRSQSLVSIIDTNDRMVRDSEFSFKIFAARINIRFVGEWSKAAINEAWLALSPLHAMNRQFRQDQDIDIVPANVKYVEMIEPGVFAFPRKRALGWLDTYVSAYRLLHMILEPDSCR
jgi:hypothetical protein